MLPAADALHRFPCNKCIHVEVPDRGRKRLYLAAHLFSLALFLPSASWSELNAPKAPSTETTAETPNDTLGRDTPRRTVLRFLSAARKVFKYRAAIYVCIT